MIEEVLLKRIAVNPEIFGGQPIIRGMRISVELILSLLAQGETSQTILADYPALQPDDLSTRPILNETLVTECCVNRQHQNPELSLRLTQISANWFASKTSPIMGLIRLPDVPTSERLRIVEDIITRFAQQLKDASIISEWRSRSHLKVSGIDRRSE